MARHTLSIFGCGGFGSNIVQRCVNLPDDEQKPLFPKTNIHILDTSDSNLDASRNDISHFLIPGMQGAGKNRRLAFEGTEPHVQNILNKHKPSDFNIVIFSGAGGSGSVIGPLVLGELLRRAIPVVALVVGVTDCADKTRNTLRTLETFQKMIHSGSTGSRPIVFSYLENKRAGNAGRDWVNEREANDDLIEQRIRELATLFSGLHRGLDRTDLTNWLNWRNNHPDIPAQMAELLIFKDREGSGAEFDKMEAYRGASFTSASLLNNENDALPDLDLQSTCEGYVRESVREYADIPNHHFVVTPARIGTIYDEVRQRLATLEEVRGSLQQAPAVGSPMLGEVTDGNEDKGMAF